jgi:hypothetical protein
MIDTQPRETIHIYYERAEEKRPYTLLPLLFALLCLLGIAAVTIYSAQHPYYEHQRLTVPVQLLPPKMFTATTPIIPTGVKSYPATAAHGTLTITNGSVVAQTLPAGLILLSNNGVQVATDEAINVPAGSADGFGRATVTAHVVTAGINLAALAVNQTLGTSVYVRNLQPFTGGKLARTVRFVTAQDKHTALLQARAILLSKSSGLHYPCTEEVRGAVTVTWRCGFVSYHLPALYHVTAVRLSGKNLIIDVFFVPRPARVWAK